MLDSIDHFLGKEAVQNILALRFANGLMEPVWNAEHLAYVQIDVPVGFVALEPPVVLDAESLHEEKAKVFRAVRPLDPDRVVFGQYAGYRDEDGVDDDSRVETFVAHDHARLPGAAAVDVRGGDRRRPERAGAGADRRAMRAKVPGPEFAIGPGRLNLSFDEAFADAEPLEAYEKLLLDAMAGDHTLFTSTREVKRLWELCHPVLAGPPPTRSYEQGSWGPQEALDLAGERGWRLPQGDSAQ